MKSLLLSVSRCAFGTLEKLGELESKTEALTGKLPDLFER